MRGRERFKRNVKLPVQIILQQFANNEDDKCGQGQIFYSK